MRIFKNKAFYYWSDILLLGVDRHSITDIEKVDSLFVANSNSKQTPLNSEYILKVVSSPLKETGRKKSSTNGCHVLWDNTFFKVSFMLLLCNKMNNLLYCHMYWGMDSVTTTISYIQMKLSLKRGIVIKFKNCTKS